jgi:HAAS
MSRQGPPEPGAGPAVEGYLAGVAARLPGPARAQADIVAELRSGLLDAADAHRSAGLGPAQAARAAIREFGDPAQVAAGFRAEIAAGQARRVAVALLVTGPLVGLLWIVTAMASHLRIPPALPGQWAGLSSGLRAGTGLVAVAAGVTACAAILGIATTGRLTRWLPVRPRRAPAAAAVAGFGAVSADGLGLALLAAQLATVPGKLSPVPAAAAAAASLARLILARRAARHCLAIRASLT